MKFMRSVFIAGLLLSAAAANTLGQTGDRVLANGNPPLTQSMVTRLESLFEWSLGAEFTTGDRAAFQAQIVSYWEKKDAKSVQSMTNSLAFEQKLKSWDATQKAEAQPQIRQKLIEALESDPADEMNRLLLAVYSRSGSLDSERENYLAAAPNGGKFLPELVGKWQVSHMNSLTTQNIYSGAVGAANGMIAEYDFKADGSFIYSFYLSQNNSGCTTKIKTSKTGRAVIEGSRITFLFNAGKTTSEDNCNARFNYTKIVPASRETFDFNLKRESSGGGKTQFCFANDKLKDCAVKIK